MRHVTLALLLAAAAFADDTTKAPATRWNHARGPASACGESYAEPPESIGGIAWTYKAKRAVLFTPVVWDGAVFVVDGDEKSAELVALDAETGETWARIAVHAPGQPAVYSRCAFLVEEGKKVVQFRLSGREFSREWTYETGPGTSAPRIVDGEIYVTTPAALFNLHAGISKPQWKVDAAFAGEPSVRDDHVYALRRDGGRLLLSLYARADGKEAGTVELTGSPGAGNGRIAVGNRIVAALLPPEENHTWALIERKPGNPPELTFTRTEKMLTDPLAGDYSLLALSDDPRTWTIYYTDDKRPRIPRVTAKDRPELFEASAPCIWLGEASQVFGDWCGNILSNIIYWHARERPETAPLRKGVRFNPVPARDQLLLFVAADGKSIRALVPEEIQ